MIKSFRNAAAEAAWARRFVKGVPNDIIKVAHRKLMQIHNARTLDDLRAPPGNRLEALAGDRKGAYSVRINDQWRRSAFAGRTAMPMTSRSSIITEERFHG